MKTSDLRDTGAKRWKRTDEKEKKTEKLRPERLPSARLRDHSERDNEDKQNALADGRIDCVDDADETKADREEESRVRRMRGRNGRTIG